jgi:hypothetical protein
MIKNNKISVIIAEKENIIAKAIPKDFLYGRIYVIYKGRIELIAKALYGNITFKMVIESYDEDADLVEIRYGEWCYPVQVWNEMYDAFVNNTIISTKSGDDLFLHIEPLIGILKNNLDNKNYKYLWYDKDNEIGDDI